MPMFFACLLAFAADPTVKLPVELAVQPGRLLKIEAATSGKVIRWVNVSEDADLIVSESGRWAIFSSTVAGRYKVFAWTAAGDVPSEASVCVITVGKPGPNPPHPTPVPPLPEDPLKNAIQAMYGADGSPKKATHKAALVDCYSTFAEAAKDKRFTKAGDFFAACRKVIAGMMTDDDLRPIREKFGEELNRKLPTDPEAAMTDLVRLEAATLFLRFARILGEIP